MTAEEMRDQFLRGVARRIDYWLLENRAATPAEKLEGLAFSLLAMLDGSSLDVPGCQVVPQGGEGGWRAEDIAGGLHEHFHRVLRETRATTKGGA